MSPTRRFVEKRCDKCGTVAQYRPRVRRCRHQKFGPRSYWCYGRLVPLPVAKPKVKVKAKKDDDVAVPVPPGKGLGWVLSEEAMEMRTQERGARVRAEARRKFDDINERIVDKQRQVARLTGSISALQRKATYYARRVAMTDAQVAAERQARLDQQARRAASAPRRRGIMLPGGDE